MEPRPENPTGQDRKHPGLARPARREPPSPGGAVIPAVSTPPTSAPSVPFSRSGFPRKAPPRRSGPSIEEPFPSGLSSFPLTGGFPPVSGKEDSPDGKDRKSTRLNSSHVKISY